MMSPVTGAAVEIVNVNVPDVPPPGADVITLTGTDFAVARSDAVTSNRSCVALTTVVGRVSLSHRACVDATNPLPFTVIVSPPLPSVAVAGARLVATGTGGCAAAAVNVAAAVVLALTVTVQASAPLQAPLHPANVEPFAGVGVRVIGVPAATD